MNNLSFKQNIVAGLVTVAVAIAAFAFTFEMPGHAPIFPRVASSIMFLLGALLIVFNWLDIRRGAVATRKPVNYSDFINPLYSVILMIGYIVCITLLGFYTATALMMIVYMHHLGIRSLRTLATVTVIMSVLIYLIFTLQLEVPLPRGLLL